MKQGLGKALPNKIPMGQNERTANYGTSVESCSLPARALLPLSWLSLITRFQRSGLLRFSQLFCLLPSQRFVFSLVILNTRKMKSANRLSLYNGHF